MNPPVSRVRVAALPLSAVDPNDPNPGPIPRRRAARGSGRARAPRSLPAGGRPGRSGPRRLSGRDGGSGKAEPSRGRNIAQPVEHRLAHEPGGLELARDDAAMHLARQRVESRPGLRGGARHDRAEDRVAGPERLRAGRGGRLVRVNATDGKVTGVVTTVPSGAIVAMVAPFRFRNTALAS